MLLLSGSLKPQKPEVLCGDPRPDSASLVCRAWHHACGWLLVSGLPTRECSYRDQVLASHGSMCWEPQFQMNAVHGTCGIVILPLCTSPSPTSPSLFPRTTLADRCKCARAHAQMHTHTRKHKHIWNQSDAHSHTHTKTHQDTPSVHPRDLSPHTQCPS